MRTAESGHEAVEYIVGNQNCLEGFNGKDPIDQNFIGKGVLWEGEVV